MAGSAALPVRAVTFRVGGDLYAIEADAVREVLSTPPITRVPFAPAALKGVANLRGKPSPILALEHLIDGVRAGQGGKILVLAGDAGLGLEVDAVRAVETLKGAEGDPRLVEPATLFKAVPGVAGKRPQARAAHATAPGARTDDTAFLVVALCDQSYALRLSEITEVSHPPEVRALPGADEAVLGAVDHRGRVLALLHPAVLLGLPVKPAGPLNRMVVARVGQTTLAFMVDAVEGVVRVPAQQLSKTPAILNRSAGEGRIEAILRTERGLVSVLSVEKLFDDRSLALLSEDGTQDEAVASVAGGERMLIACLGAETYALPLAQVEAVTRPPTSLTPAPGAPDYVAGLFSHRGAAIPLVDQGLQFGKSPAGPSEGRVVVVNIGDRQAGLLFDSVERIADVPESDLSPISAEADGLFDRVADSGSAGPRLVVAVEALLGRTARELMSAVARR